MQQYSLSYDEIMQVENSTICHPDLNDNTVDDYIKEAVWINYFGNDQYHGKCFICKTRIGRNSDILDTCVFMCAHYISSRDGGLTHPNNLKPVCQYCHIKLNGRSLSDLSHNSPSQSAYHHPIPSTPTHKNSDSPIINISMDIESCKNSSYDFQSNNNGVVSGAPFAISFMNNMPSELMDISF